MTTPAGRIVSGEFRPWSTPAPGRYCLAICYCGTCKHYQPLPPPRKTVQRGTRTTVPIDKEAFLVRFTDYVRSLPIGTEFTTADVHGKIPDPPHPNHWGHAQRHVADLHLTRQVTAQKSQLGTTKSSLVRRWVRIDEAAERDVAS